MAAGEMDLVLQRPHENHALYLVEVRSRVRGQFAPRHAITYAKIRRLHQLAYLFSAMYRCTVRLHFLEIDCPPHSRFSRLSTLPLVQLTWVEKCLFFAAVRYPRWFGIVFHVLSLEDALEKGTS